MPRPPGDDTRSSAPRQVSRRAVLGWGALLANAGALWPLAARAQRLSEAPLAPREALEDVRHRFWKDLLEDFPLEPEEKHFDNAEIGIPPLQTLERMTSVARDVTAHAEATAAKHIEAAREGAARFFGADAVEMGLAPNATEAMRRIAEALPLEPGAVVAISEGEPSASLVAWQALARQKRVRIKRFETHSPGSNKLRNPRKWLDDAAVVVLSHVLPTSGALLPLADVCAEAQRRNVWVVANGSHAAGMVSVDLHALGVDAYITSGSGWLLGPRGTALLYVRQSRFSQLAVRHRALPDDAGEDPLAGAVGVDEARTFELEPPSASLMAGLATSLDWLSGIGVETVRDHAAKLAMQVHAGLKSVRGIELLSSEKDIGRVPIVSLRVSRRPNWQVADWLLENLSMRVHRVDTNNLNAVRASTHVVNRPDDLDWFVEALRTLA